MSIYDDLANSGYLDKDQFRQQLQAYQQQEPNFQPLDQSLDNHREFTSYNAFSDFEGVRLNQEDNFYMPQKQATGEPLQQQKKQFQLSQDDYETEQPHMNHALYQQRFGADKESELKQLLQFASNSGPSFDLPSDKNRLFKGQNSDKFLEGSEIRQVNDPYDSCRPGMGGKQAYDNFEFYNSSERRNVHLDDDDILQMQTVQQTGRFATQKSETTSACQVGETLSIDQFRQNNDQLQQLLMQLQVPSQTQQQQQQQRPLIPKPNANIQMMKQHSEVTKLQNMQFANPTFSGPELDSRPGMMMAMGAGPTYEKLNKDNSILEIAKMQNSGNGSNSDTCNSHHTQPSRDFSPQLASGQNRLDIMSQHSQITANQQFAMAGNNSLASYQKFIPPYPSNIHTRQVSDILIDKENLDQNIFQLREQPPAQHAHQFMPTEPNFNQYKPQQAPFPAGNLYDMQQDYQKFQQPNPQPVPMAGNQPKTSFYNRQMSQQEAMRREIMDKFDEIPIKELNKAEGYQQPQMTEDNNQDDDLEEGKSLMERIDHPKWKIRMKAYKEISELFYTEYSKECAKSKFEQNPMQVAETEEDEMNPNPFDFYGPVLQRIISDNNLVAQYEGLGCLFAYVRFAPEIKSIIFQVHTILLEKIQHNKPNLREITTKIILCIIKRDKSQTTILPELLKRFKAKNTKIANFALENISEAFKNNLLAEESVLRQVFKAVSDVVGHSSKEVRDSAIEVLKNIFKLCNDDASSFSRNLKSLRPIQLKEIKDMLSEVEKAKSSLSIVLFPLTQAQTYTEGFTPKKNKGKAGDDFVNEIGDQDKDIEGDDNLAAAVPTESDLMLLVPENFNEIPYMTQINVKKKAMEAFNQELEKLVNRKQVTVISKDYQQIFNVVTHMLEDSNALVFMEAIKTVEYLALLIGKQIKPQKLRQFIALLSDKYKETKTAPVQAVNKALSTIIKKQTISLCSLVEYIVGQLVHNNKNPRVKQLLLEKVDSTLLEEKQIKEEELSQLFKSIKDKIIGFIQKDTNAGVRDAGVSLLTTFKALMPDNASVTESISSLPKYRVAEINKAAIDRQVAMVKANSQAQEPENSAPSIQQNPASHMQPKHSKSARDVASSANGNDFSYQGRSISGQYQIPLGEIILSLKKIAASSSAISSLKIHQIQPKWDIAIENLGEFGIKEAKPVIVSCIHWVLAIVKVDFTDNQGVLEAMLILMKQIFCIERSVEKDTSTGGSRELDQAIEVILEASQQLFNRKQVDALMNVVFSASGMVTDFIEALSKALTLHSKPPVSRGKVAMLEFTFKWLAQKLDQLLSKGMVFSDFEDIRAIGLKYLSDLIDEETKSRVIQILVEFKNAIMAKKKQMEYIDESSIEQAAEDQDDDKEDVKTIVGHIPRSKEGSEEPNEFALPGFEQNQRKKPASAMPMPVKTLGEQIVETLDNDFEKGLVLIKGLVTDLPAFDFQSKEMVFERLLKTVTSHCKNPQQQYQQAYALKALLWMKEELFGLEDCFKFTSKVMFSFAKAELEGRDNSVELYLLNHWVKELSLRDLIDRVSNSCNEDDKVFVVLLKWLMLHSLSGNTEGKWAIEDFRKVALLLARNVREEAVEDFFQQTVDKFAIKKVLEFMEIQLMRSPSEYNIFMTWFNMRFKAPVDDSLESGRLQQQLQQDRLVLPNIGGNAGVQLNVPGAKTSDQFSAQKQVKAKFEDLELRDALIANAAGGIYESGVIARGKSAGSAHSKLYQQMREQRKTTHHKKAEDESINKYDQIINRLEAQLQQPSGRPPTSGEKDPSAYKQDSSQKQQQQDFNFYKSGTSQQYQSEKSHRYHNMRTTDEEQSEDDESEQLRLTTKTTIKEAPIITQQDTDASHYNEEEKEPTQIGKQKMMSEVNEAYQILETESKLRESSVKESIWREEMAKLEVEKRRIEKERETLMLQKNKETVEWRTKYESMRHEHEDVMTNLKEANRCYLLQVGENEELKKQLKMMQEQHSLMMRKFQEFAEKLNQQTASVTANDKLMVRKGSPVRVVKEEKLALIKNTFAIAATSDHQEESALGIKKIQELLLNIKDHKHLGGGESGDIGEPLYFYYQQIKHSDQRLKLVKSLQQSIESEDVLLALPIDTYRSLLDFTLKAFSNEKAKLEQNSIRVSQSMSRPSPSEQNEITIEVQKIVSRLLNSKEFTTSLVTLFSILRNAMPEDLAVDLREEQRQYLRVIMRCVGRITKALHSEHPDLIRGFDVLLEMQKIFLKNPPEKLREDLPCLADFDLVYRGLKDVTDKLMDLQPEKVAVFLEFIKDHPSNAFIKYMIQIMSAKKMFDPQASSSTNPNHYHEADDEEEGELYEEGY